MVTAITFDCWDTLLADDSSRTIERKRFFGQVLSKNGIAVTAQAIDDLFNKEALESLSGKYALAVICNTGWHSGKIVRQLLARNDLPRFFSHLTFSDEAGLAKPHRQIFEYTLEKLGCRPEEAVHVGDSEYSDIVGAKEAGMKAILFTGINDKYKEDNSADVSISTYDRFLEVIKNLG